MDCKKDGGEISTITNTDGKKYYKNIVSALKEKNEYTYLRRPWNFDGIYYNLKELKSKMSYRVRLSKFR